MDRTTKTALALAAAGLVVLAPGAEGSDRAELGVTLSARTAGTPTGLDFRVLYKRPGDPGGKPPALARAAFALPAGTRFDTRATPTCHATNQQLQALGRAACPAGSIVGTGTFTAITGLGAPVDPFAGDLTAFNGGTELIELVTVKGSNAGAGIDRLAIEGNVLRADPPATPGGPPDGRTAVREVRLRIPARGDLVTAPPRCPAAGEWTSHGEFGFIDGGSTRVSATSPCRATAGARGRTRLRVSPRRARVGRRITLRVRARAAVPRCAGGARIRVGSRRGRTSRTGRATLRFHFGAAGRRRVTLVKPGCPRAYAFVRVGRR